MPAGSIDRVFGSDQSSAAHRTALGVAKRYAIGLRPLATWVCNHCDFRQPVDPDTNHGDSWTRIHIAAQFRPGNVPSSFTESVRIALMPPSDVPVRRAFGAGHFKSGFVLVVDVTASMTRVLDEALRLLVTHADTMRFDEYRAILYTDHGAHEPFLVRKLGPLNDLTALIALITSTAHGHGGDNDEALEDAMERCRELSEDIGPQSFLVLTDAAPHRTRECPYHLDYAREVQAILSTGSRILIASDWLKHDDRTKVDVAGVDGFRLAPLTELIAP